MTWSDLSNFFTMHGENVDRKSGRPGRGLFGTGKSAAFGIADCLRVTTVRNQKRSKVQLTRTMINFIQGGHEIPVEALEREVPTDQDNGTLIEIEGIHLRKIDQMAVIQYIERHIAKWPGATVFVNNHQCEYSEPEVDRIFEFSPDTEEQRSLLGDTRLEIKVSKLKLDEDQRGIGIYCDGVWYETTLAGSDRREMSEYIFGSIDVPGLSADKSEIAAFDMSRSMTLNRSNPTILALFGFLGSKIEIVRRELVEEERKKRLSEEAKKLAKEASLISNIINQDFENRKLRLDQVHAKSRGKKDFLSKLAPQANFDDNLINGGSHPGVTNKDTSTSGDASGKGSKSGAEPKTEKLLNFDPDGKESGTPVDSSASKSRNKGGGFSVVFREIGTQEARAKYERDERVIYINLDHPQMKKAKQDGGTETPEFKRLSYEVAFTEYAIALAREMIMAGEYLELDEPAIDLRDTIDRVTRAAAHLY